MTWLLFRLYRRSVAFWILLGMALAVIVAASWWTMAAAISGQDVHACLALISTLSPSAQQEGQPPVGGTCSTAAIAALDAFRTTDVAIAAALWGFPLVLGMFMAAPLMGRELENGTHRLIWTQSVTPTRWVVIRLLSCVGFSVVLLLVVAMAAMPWLSLGSIVSSGSPWPDFDLRIPTLLSYGMFAVALGFAAATVTGRTVVAMAITAAVWGGVRFAFETLIRPHLMSPLVAKGVTAGTAGTNWFLGITYLDSAGHALGWAQVTALVGSGSFQDHGISIAGLVQPAERFWIFQSMEAAFFVGLSVVCAIIAIAWVRLRLASQ